MGGGETEGPLERPRLSVEDVGSVQSGLEANIGVGESQGADLEGASTGIECKLDWYKLQANSGSADHGRCT